MIDYLAAATEINRRLSCLEVPPLIKDELGHDVASKIRGWCSYASRFGPAQYDKAQSKLARIMQARTKQIGVAENASYRDWVTKALEKGAGPAHAWTRQTERAPPLPEFIEDGEDILADPVEKTEYFSRF